MKIKNKILSGCIVIIGFISILGWFAFTKMNALMQQLTVSIEQTLTTLRQNAHTERLLTQLLHYQEMANANLFNYSLIQDNKWLQRYRGYSESIIKISKNLRQITTQHTDQALNHILHLSKRLSHHQTIALTRLNVGDTIAAHRFLDNEKYQLLLTRFNKTIETYLATHNLVTVNDPSNALITSLKSLHAVRQQHLRSLLIYSMLILLLMFGNIIYLSRIFTNAMQHLKNYLQLANHNQLAADEHTVLARTDEIGDIARLLHNSIAKQVETLCKST